MRYLVLKDLLLQKHSLWFLVLGPLFLSYSIGGTQVVFSASYIGQMIVFSGISRMSDQLWISLPVPRWKIVGAKYLAILPYVAITFLMVWLNSFILTLVGLPWASSLRSLTFTVNVLCGVVLGTTVLLPIYFALGYRKSWIFPMTFGIVAAVQTSFGAYLRELTWLHGLIENFGYGLVILGFCAVIAILWSISFSVSLKLYRAREF